MLIKVWTFNNTPRMEELIGIAHNMDRLRAVAEAPDMLVPTPVKP